MCLLLSFTVQKESTAIFSCSAKINLWLWLLYRTDSRGKFCSVQQHYIDCGVFSIAFYADALDGYNDIGQYNNAEKMSFCFLTCLKNEVFSPFRRSTKRSKTCSSTIFFLLTSFVFVTDRFLDMKKSKIPKCSWLIGVNATSSIIRNV